MMIMHAQTTAHCKAPIQHSSQLRLHGVQMMALWLVADTPLHVAEMKGQKQNTMHLCIHNVILKLMISE